MSYYNNINWSFSTDRTIAERIGLFVKHSRLNQNRSQQELASAAGINRSTLSLFEGGKKSVSLLTLIQLLRALDLLSSLAIFDSKPQISPLLLAEQELKLRKRAAKGKPIVPQPKSDW